MENSCSGSSDYAALTLSLIENGYSSQTQQKVQFIHRKRNQNCNSYEIVETSHDQLPQQVYENMTKVSCRFYRQVTYDEQLQEYVLLIPVY